MSTICGVVQHDLAPRAGERCRIVQAALEPWGKNAESLWDGEHAAMARRLSNLLPEDVHDRQPLTGADGRFVLVADLRIDNRDELADALRISAPQLRSMADADILLAAYEAWGHDVVDHLVGDFAFAVWDCRDRTLFLARDHLGRIPLFYHRGAGWFAFASMPAGLLALPGVARGADEERLRDLLFLLPDVSEHSYYAGIDRLLPGHAAVVTADGEIRRWRYWAPPIDERISFKCDDDYVEAFIEILQQVVRCRLRSTGGVASQMSAGFDSATVSSVAAGLLAEKGLSLDAFTAVPAAAGLPVVPDLVMDESHIAAQVAALFPNVRHHRVATDDDRIFDTLATMAQYYNRPAKNVVNMIWEPATARAAAARGCTTLLNGALGNFTISYNGADVLNTLLREGRLVDLARQAWGEWRYENRKASGIAYRTLTPSLPESLQDLAQRLFVSTDGPNLLSGLNMDALADPVFQAHCRQTGRRPGHFARPQENRRQRQMLLTRHDFAEYSKGTLACAGVDTRDPTCDIRLIRYCQSIPLEQFRKEKTDRWLLRRALRRYWPESIIASRVKGKQAADSGWRIRRELTDIHDLIRSLRSLPQAERLLDLAVIEKQLPASPSQPLDGNFGDNFKTLRLIAAGHFMQAAHPSGR